MPRRLKILVVDDHESVGPPSGDALDRREDSVRGGVPSLVEVKPVGRVGNHRPPGLGHPAHDETGHECGDGCVDVHDVGSGLEDLGDGLDAAPQAVHVADRSREREFVDMIKGVRQCSVAPGTVCRGIDPPPHGAEMLGVGTKELVDRARDGGHDQQGRPTGVGHLGASF